MVLPPYQKLNFVQDHAPVLGVLGPVGTLAHLDVEAVSRKEFAIAVAAVSCMPLAIVGVPITTNSGFSLATLVLALVLLLILLAHGPTGIPGLHVTRTVVEAYKRDFATVTVLQLLLSNLVITVGDQEASTKQMEHNCATLNLALVLQLYRATTPLGLLGLRALFLVVLGTQPDNVTVCAEMMFILLLHVGAVM